MSSRFSWTPSNLDRLRDLTNRGVDYRKIAEDLGCGDERTVRRMQFKLGLASRKFVHRKWTKEEEAMLIKMYPDASVADLCATFQRPIERIYAAAKRRNLHRSAEYMASPAACRLRRGDNVGAAFRFKKGIVPANKGLRRPGYAPGRMAETQFKKGQRSKTWRPIGTILEDNEGFLRIKIRERKPDDPKGWTPEVWPLLSWHNWSKVHGPVPRGHRLVFRDGNRANCEVDNLELVSTAELMRRNTIHNLPPKLKQVIQLKGAIRAQVTRIRKREANA